MLQRAEQIPKAHKGAVKVDTDGPGGCPRDCRDLSMTQTGESAEKEDFSLTGRELSYGIP